MRSTRCKLTSWHQFQNKLYQEQDPALVTFMVNIKILMTVFGDNNYKHLHILVVQSCMYHNTFLEIPEHSVAGKRVRMLAGREAILKPEIHQWQGGLWL